MKKIKIQIKSQITNLKLQTIPDLPDCKSRIFKVRALYIWMPFIIYNLVFCAWNPAYLYAQDKIIAIVNSDVITQKDLDDFINFTRLQLSKEYKGIELEERIQSMKLDLLDKLIEDRLILHEARQNNLKVDEDRVRARINEIRKYYPSDSEFQKDIAKQGLVQADIEEKMREQFLMYNIIDEKVRSRIVVSPKEVTNFYNKNMKLFVSSEERDLEVIIIDKEDLAQSFSYNLKTGEKLTDLASRYPITLNRLKVTRKGELRKDIEDEVFKLGVAEISGPIKLDDKYYILKLDNIIAARQQTLSEVQDKIHSFLFEEKMQEGLKKWLDELKAHSYIKILQS